jgi:hypothetical protein
MDHSSSHSQHAHASIRVWRKSDFILMGGGGGGGCGRVLKINKQNYTLFTKNRK